MFDPQKIDCSPQVEFAAKAFIASWLTNHDQRIDELLTDIPEDMQAEAHDVLIRLELYMRSSTGESLEESEYLKRFPDYKEEVWAAFHQESSVDDDGDSARPPTKDLDTRSESVISEDSSFLFSKGGADADVVPEKIGRYLVETELGRGGFGVVCLAHDTQLDRKVALKFARTSRFSTVEEMEKLIDEARTAAKLDCPGIVAVYDVIVEEEFICIVQQLIDGQDLSQALAVNRPTFEEAATWMVSICSAIAVAHSKGFIHRDLKPANILLDFESSPHITDFGLAIHESYQRRRRGDRSGTPGYMSPELVRGESHRIDGRSDIWSLGVILYLMLTGKKPFSGESAAEIFDEIKHREPRPPREIRPEIPAELERICLKCLNKPVGQRFSTARDMARDLRRWLQEASTHSLADSMSDRIHEVIPKGLRSFDEEDAEFFVKLLPGPVGRSGLPESVQAWKRRLGKDSDDPMPVGLLYGPSGCGKSSYVKAGLLPYLPSYFKKFRVEATPADTEIRLIKSLRSRYSDIPSELSLPELFQSLREGVWTEGGDRILIVIDQFEQWLHNRNTFSGTELVEALRQCDGKRLQCLLMVRDDFWLATSRFLHALEVDLVEGKNAGLIDLFDIPHAERVLKQYGRGYHRIGEEITKPQEDFVKLAVEQLAEDGKVVCVRLSLFAEMFKDKPWNVSSLKRAGGISGVGVAFLEETFSSKNSPAKNRVHETAARSVLGALLPESSVDIRGNMRSRQDLLHLSGYTNRPNAFLELLNLLDQDLRLITPTDPTGLGDTDSLEPGAAHDFYQLTHDYLVAPLRIWLHQKNRETASGRAQLRLDERHATWTRTKENRFLPAAPEYLNIRTLTRRKNWSTGEREMMSKADRHHGVRFAVMAAFTMLATFAGMQWYGNVQANSLARRLIDAELSEVPAITQEMKERNLDERVASIIEATDLNDNRRKLLNVEVAFSHHDQKHQRLWDRLNNEVNADEAVVAANAYQATENETEQFWTLLRSEREITTDRRRLRAAVALAHWDADDDRWQDVSYSIVSSLLAQNPIVIRDWFEAMPTIRVQLLRELIRHTAEWKLGADQQTTKSAIGLIEEHQKSWPEINEHLRAEMDQADFFRRIGGKPENDIEKFESMTQQQANLATILLVLGATDHVLEQMNLPDRERLNALLVKQAVDFSVDASLLLDCLESESRPEVRSALWLMLGNYYPTDSGLPESALKLAKSDYHSNPSAIVHSATEWFIRHAGQQEWLNQQALASISSDSETERTLPAYPAGQTWRQTSQQHTMIRIAAPGPFIMSHKRTVNIDYDFEVSSKEISVEQFLRFNNSQTVKKNVVKKLFDEAGKPEELSRRRPVAEIVWFQAAEYCNWLSQQEGIPKDQWCYEDDPAPVQRHTQYEVPDLDKKGKRVLRLVSDFRNRSGYRLPLESEWEWLAAPSWDESFHTSTFRQLLAENEWFSNDALTQPVGTKKPSRLGLFDIFGNVKEFCSDPYSYFERGDFVVKEGSAYQDPIELSKDRPEMWASDRPKLFRGVAIFYRDIGLNRDPSQPKSTQQHLGFRVVRALQNE